MVTQEVRSPWSNELPDQKPGFLLEQRVGLELFHLFSTSVYYGINVPPGEGRRILFVPGYLGSDLDFFSTTFTSWLSRIGYQTHRVGILQNLGWKHTWDRTEQVAEHLSESGPITMVGHSLGGIIGRRTAKRLGPDRISQVVTLGSPFLADPQHPEESAHRMVAGALRTTSLWDPFMKTGEAETFLAQASEPLPERTRSINIHTEEDGVVNWTYCIDPHPKAANVLIGNGAIDLQQTLQQDIPVINIKLRRGTHTGLIVNSDVYGLLGNLILPTQPSTTRAY